MSNLIPHTPDPTFWKKYYTDQAKGRMYARATPTHRTKSQRGAGVAKTIVTAPLKLISPVEQNIDRAQSQIKRKLEEVGGARKKKTTIKGEGKGKKSTQSVGKCQTKKSTKRKKATTARNQKKLNRTTRKRDIFS
jgi:hypothetical protein